MRLINSTNVTVVFRKQTLFVTIHGSQSFVVQLRWLTLTYVFMIKKDKAMLTYCKTLRSPLLDITFYLMHFPTNLWIVFRGNEKCMLLIVKENKLGIYFSTDYTILRIMSWWNEQLMKTRHHWHGHHLKGPAWNDEKEDFTLTLTYDLEFFRLSYNLRSISLPLRLFGV